MAQNQTRVVNLIRERRSENEYWVDTFIIADNVQNPEQALREAVAEFLASDAGKEEIERSCHDFNWGDAVMAVPDAIWEKHGLSLCRENIAVDVLVDQDEVLCQGELGIDVTCGHTFEPTDNQGHAMECMMCGRFISIDNPADWDEGLSECCPNAAVSAGEPCGCSRYQDGACGETNQSCKLCIDEATGHQ